MRGLLLRRLRIQARLFIGLGILVSLLAGTSLIWHNATQKILVGLRVISSTHYPRAEASMEMQLAVMEVQRFFSNAALTREASHIEEARAWHTKFTKNLERVRNLAKDQSLEAMLDDLKKDFDAYFKLAEVMAQLYVAGDAEGGDSAMIDVDAFADILRGKISIIVGQTSAHLRQTLFETEDIALQTSARNMILSAVIVLVAIALAFFLAASITVPLREIIIRLSGIAQEGVADLSTEIEVEADDEISEVGQLYNEFIQKIRSIIIELGGMAEHLASATTQLSASSEQSSRQARSQQSAVQEMATSITAVNKAISRIATRSVDVARTSTHTHEQAVSGGKIITESAATIEKLTEYSSKIGNILMVIEDIAKKTDLLAINAAIEAANAGEQGKGFAVVADEVRKLAERTTRATGEIGHMIQDIQGLTGSAASSMQGSIVAMESIIEEATGVNTMIDEIAAATEKQSGIVNAMLTNVRSVTEMTDGFSAQTEQSEKVSSEINEQTIKLQEVVDRFRVSS